MTGNSIFKQLYDRARRGDADAALELVETYETELRIVIRSRLREARMRRVLDSMDLCQSVFCNFFVRAAGGQYDLQSPQELMQLLVTMARNKLTDHARHEHAEKRDARQLAPSPAEQYQVAANDSTPSQVLAARELLEQLHAKMDKATLRIAEMRREGIGWDEIGRRLGMKSDTVRKRFTRSLDKACEDLGLDSQLS